MLVNLGKIFHGEEKSKQLELELDLSSENVSCDVKFLKPVRVVLNFTKSNQQTIIVLTVSAQAQCTCARCLELFNREISFSQEFIVGPSILTELEPEIPVSSDNILDVKQLVVQELSLEVSTVYLCDESCEGLCQYCGKPKKENCSCQSNQIDPRLLVLKQLLQDDDN